MRQAIILFVLCAILTGGCGSTRLSEAAFRTKANAICRDFTRRTNTTSFSSESLSKALSTIEDGIARLGRLQPPARDAAQYADFLRHLRRLLTFAKKDGPELLALTKQLDQAIRRRTTTHGTRRAVRRYKQVLQRINALEAPVEHDVRAANAEARSLHLQACAVGGTGT
jgi:hypothetical protein